MTVGVEVLVAVAEGGAKVRAGVTALTDPSVQSVGLVTATVGRIDAGAIGPGSGLVRLAT
jgi:hypothetical protein